MIDPINEMNRRGPVRTAGASLWIGVIAVIMIVGGAVGSGQGVWPFTIGLLMVVLGLLFGLIGGIFGLVAMLWNRGGGDQGRRISIGLLLSLVSVVAVGPWIYRGFSNPPIHDVTTDIANRPAFTAIVVRDNIANDKWRALHAKAYGDIQPLVLAKSQADVMTIAARLVTARGWEVTPTAADRIEATEIVSLFKFKDDVAIIATPSADGQSTIINMRSISRVGESDFGINAKRVRAFLADLKAAAI